VQGCELMDSRILKVLGAVSAAMVLSACGASYDSSRIRKPDGDLNTDRVADGPDGKKHSLSGQASWYGEQFHGRQTASGETYDMYRFTAAHKTLPFHTVVRVVEPNSRKSVVVRITDRGPFTEGRVIDLSYAAAVDLGLIGPGILHVELEVIEWGDGSRVRE
jgi:rare lipoprotein A